MTQYIIRRLIITLPVLLGVSVVVFALVRFIPGDPAQLLAGQGASADQIELVRARLGLDEPLIVQYFIFIGNLLQGDMGDSILTGLPVTAEIMSRLPNSLLLALVALLIASVVGTVAGIISGVKQYSMFDYSSTLAVLLAISVPVFWLALLVMLLFSLTLHWLPATGFESWRHLILPAFTLGAVVTALVARMARSSVLDVIQQDYVRTARAKGLSERLVILRHVLKNALIPIVTIIGMLSATLISGALFTEIVFAWPGIGRLLVEAILHRDYPVIQGVVLVYAVIFILVNLVVDISYTYIDPRIRYQ